MLKITDIHWRCLCLFLFFAIATIEAVAEEKSSCPSSLEMKQETMKEAFVRGQLTELESNIAVARSRIEYQKEIDRINNARNNYQVALYEKEIALRNSEVELFNNQQKMEMPIFGLVLVIVLASLYLAHAQLKAWLRKDGAAKPADATALSINRDGLTLNTPFVGLLMLMGAFAFFYMYIDKVYSIQQRSGALRNQIEQYPSNEVEKEASSATASQTNK